MKILLKLTARLYHGKKIYISQSCLCYEFYSVLFTYKHKKEEIKQLRRKLDDTSDEGRESRDEFINTGKNSYTNTRRVSSKKEKKFDSNRKNRNKICFGFCFGLFRETKTKKVRFVSVFRTYIETTETNRTVSKQTEITINFLKNTKIRSLSNCFGWSSVCFGSIETSKLSVSV
jgi:hypothetical protein